MSSLFKYALNLYSLHSKEREELMLLEMAHLEGILLLCKIWSLNNCRPLSGLNEASKACKEPAPLLLGKILKR